MSRGLDAFRKIAYPLDNARMSVKTYHEHLKKIEKDLIALEIIKYKKVDYYQDIVDSDSYEEYLDNFEYQVQLGNWSRKEALSQEEYSLLKEELL